MEREIKLGTKIKIPKTKKGIPYNLPHSCNSCNYYYYNGFDEEFKEHILRDCYTPYTGNFFNIEEIELYELPEKWCIKMTTENREVLAKWFSAFRPSAGYLNNPSYINKYFHFPGISFIDANYYSRENVEENYQEITFKEFKEFVLKENMENKKHISWKLIKLEYEQAALSIVQCTGFIKIGDGRFVSVDSIAEKRLKEAGVLELWFDKVYEEVAPVLPVINGKNGKFHYKEWLVVYGNNCAKFNADFFLNLVEPYKNQNRKIKNIYLDSGVAITIEEIEQIVKVIKYEADKAGKSK